LIPLIYLLTVKSVSRRFFATLQEYIFTLLIRHQRVNVLFFFNFSTP
jgi:hypothetical protein